MVSSLKCEHLEHGYWRITKRCQPGWSSQQVPDQPRLYSKALFPKTKQNERQKMHARRKKKFKALFSFLSSSCLTLTPLEFCKGAKCMAHPERCDWVCVEGKDSERKLFLGKDLLHGKNNVHFKTSARNCYIVVQSFPVALKALVPWNLPSQ